MSTPIQPADPRSSQQWQQREAILDRFEDAWRCGQRPAIADYWSAQAGDLSLLAELVQIDLELRLKAGEPVRVEEYLQQHPQLVAQPDAVLDLAAAEFALRRRREPELALDEYLDRFPQLRESLPARVGPANFSAAENRTVVGTILPVAAAAGAAPRLAQPEYAFLAPPQAPDELGRLGAYRVLKVLGAGGMGVVFQAEDPKLKRLVALKAMKPALAASDSGSHRFLREAQAIAALKHDHIVTIYQVGEDRNVPFLAMEFLDGEPLDARLYREGKLPLGEVLRIGRETAEGLAAAHERGLIHRDIKPGNLWLEASPGRQSGVARVKILDFGLVRAAGDEAHLTSQGAIVGTPAYMAPEQATGEAVDQRCDLFSLGCVLYRCCTGEQPFKGRDAMSTLYAVAHEQPRPPRELNPELPAVLSDLILHLLAKDPAERPASAQAVVEAIQAMEAEYTMVLGSGQTVPRKDASVARAGTAPVPSRRRRWLLVVLALVVLGSVAVLAPPVNRPLQEREAAKAIEQPGPPPLELPAARTGTLDDLRREQIPPYELAVAGSGDPKQAPPELVAVLGDSRLNPGSAISCVAYSSDGKHVAVGGQDGSVKVWDAATGQEELSFKGHAKGVTSVAFSPDSQRLASSGYLDSGVRLWDAATGKELLNLEGHTGSVLGVTYSRDGKRLASAGQDQTVRVWDALTGKELRQIAGHTREVSCVAFSPDGTHLVSASLDKTLKLWDLSTGKAVHSFEGHSYAVGSVSFSPDGKRLASAASDPMVKVWDTGSGKELANLKSVRAGVVAFSPDGKRLAAGCYGGLLMIWDAHTAKELFNFKAHGANVKSIAFSPDGQRLVSAVVDGAVTIWDVTTGQEALLPAGHAGSICGVAVCADGKRLASGGSDGTIRVWDAATGQQFRVLKENASVRAVAVSPDGKCLATASSAENTVKVWALETGQLLQTVAGHTSIVFSLAFSRDGTRLASGSSDYTARVWDTNSAKQVQALPCGTTVEGMAWSPDGKRLACGYGGNRLQVWDVGTAQEVFSYKFPPLAGPAASRVFARVAFSPDGTWFASANGLQMKLWETARWQEKEKARFAKHGAGISGLAYSPDGKMLVTVSTELVLYEAPLGKELRRWPLPGAATDVVFAADGRHIITANANGTLSVFRLG